MTTTPTTEKPLFGLCRDCKHWQKNKHISNRLEDYSRDIHPDDGGIDAVCKRIHHRGIAIILWGDSEVDHVETDANFGCRYFESL
jgi:hypothetical protein